MIFKFGGYLVNRCFDFVIPVLHVGEFVCLTAEPFERLIVVFHGREGAQLTDGIEDHFSGIAQVFCADGGKRGVAEFCDLVLSGSAVSLPWWSR